MISKFKIRGLKTMGYSDGYDYYGSTDLAFLTRLILFILSFNTSISGIFNLENMTYEYIKSIYGDVNEPNPSAKMLSNRYALPNKGIRL